MINAKKYGENKEKARLDGKFANDSGTTKLTNNNVNFIIAIRHKNMLLLNVKKQKKEITRKK
jgi:hypothetical protein